LSTTLPFIFSTDASPQRNIKKQKNIKQKNRHHGTAVFLRTIRILLFPDFFILLIFLRWHDPDQVMGQNPLFPLSLYADSPFCIYIHHSYFSFCAR